MHAWRIALAAWVVATAACQLDLAGEEFVAGPGSSGTSRPTDPGDGSPDATGFVSTGDPNSVQDASVPRLVVGRSPADAADEPRDTMASDAGHDGSGLGSPRRVRRR